MAPNYLFESEAALLRVTPNSLSAQKRSPFSLLLAVLQTQLLNGLSSDNVIAKAQDVKVDGDQIQGTYIGT